MAHNGGVRRYDYRRTLADEVEVREGSGVMYVLAPAVILAVTAVVTGAIIALVLIGVVNMLDASSEAPRYADSPNIDP